MRIDEMLSATRPVFSVEFFPPKTDEGRQTLFETVEDVAERQGARASLTPEMATAAPGQARVVSQP